LLLAQVQSPAQCLTLLRLLLEVLLGADKERGLRCEMYVLLLQYLLFCRWVSGQLGVVCCSIWGGVHTGTHGCACMYRWSTRAVRW
jgi:hypothetical protein